MRSWRAPAVLGAALAVAGCAGITTPSPPAPGKTIGNADSGRVIRLSRGERLRIVLTGGYWTFQGSSASSVLRQDGEPTESTPSPANCPPGLGCTPLTARFTAVTPGRARIRATRTTCGEARRCTGSEGVFSVTVIVTR